MKNLAFLLIITTCLTGCSFIFPVVRDQLSKPEVQIADDIPISTANCRARQTTIGSELVVRNSIKSQAANDFAAGKFAKLQADYKIYRNPESRTPAGRWKLQFFYEGLSSIDLGKSQGQEKWKLSEQKMLAWIDKYPDSPLPYVAYSDFLIGLGWHYRGEKFAGDVSPEAFDRFHKKIELSRSILEEHKEIASADPQWYKNMMTIAKAESWSKSEVNQLLREAISKEPYYYEIYQEGFDYLLPKWSGSFAEAETFASRAAVITNKCEGKGMYARIYWRAFNNAEFTKKPFDPAQVRWQTMSESFDDLIKYYPDPWNINSYAKFACIAKDKPKAKALFGKLNGLVAEELWKNYPRVDYSTCRKWAFIG
jgi:hypothetical protein